MFKKKPAKNWKLVLVLVLVPLLLAGGFAFGAGGAGEKLRQWFGGEEIADPLNGEGDDETEESEESEEPEETSGEEPDSEPAEPRPVADDEGKTPTIYVGQVLTIPGAGTGSSSGKSVLIEKGILSTGKKEIALTFDSGWEYTHALPLLDELDKQGVKATFFPRADWVKKHPDLGRAIVDRGHTMGNHSLTHGDMTKMSAAEIRKEMRQSTKAIEDICRVRPYLFRPPYGAYNDRLLDILGEEGYPYTIMWSIDTIDWDAGNVRKVEGKNTLVDEDFIVNRVLKNSDSRKESGIVLMHIGGDGGGHLTVKALPRIIEGLRKQGYGFTTVDRMLPQPGKATYTVKKGDTLYGISRRHGVTVQQLIDANSL